MNPVTAKIVLQIMGSLVGLSGVWVLYRTWFLGSIHDWLAFSVILPIGFFFLSIGYLAWSKRSVRSIRWISGATLFWSFWFLRLPLRFILVDKTIRDTLNILLLVALAWCYRRVWRYFAVRLVGADEQIKPL
jgi:hypothetical protein